MRLIRLIICVLVITTLVIVSVGLLGHAQPDSDNPLTALGFTHCGNYPCVFGVIPGKTSWDDAVHLLDAQHIRYTMNGPSFSSVAIHITNEKGRIILQSSAGLEHVDSVMWQSNAQPYDLDYAWLLLAYDVPCEHQDQQQASFHNLYARFINLRKTISLHAPTWMLVLYGVGSNLPSAACDRALR